MAYRDSTTASAESDAPAVNVPAGVQAGDIVILVITADTVDWSYTGLWPTGFTQFYDSNCTADGQAVGIAWKRLTGADSGTYALEDPGAARFYVMQAFAFSGRHATNPPVATETVQNTGQTDASLDIGSTGVPAAQVTAVAGDDLLWISAPDVSVDNAGNGHDAPADFIEAEDTENSWSNLSGAYRNNVSAGATGAIKGGFHITSGTAGYVAYLVRIPAAAGGPSSKITGRKQHGIMRGMSRHQELDSDWLNPLGGS